MYSPIHVGNARPFVVFTLLGRFLARVGYEPTVVFNVTDINDKIYDAAPGASARLAEEATRWYVEDTDDLQLGRLRDLERPAAPDAHPEAGEPRDRGRVGDPRLPSLAQARRQAGREGREQEARESTLAG